MNEAQESSLYPKVRKSNAPRRGEGGGSTHGSGCGGGCILAWIANGGQPKTVS
jgi:hypothetical protein